MANKPIFNIKQNDTSRSIKWYPKATPASDYTGASVVFNMSGVDGGAAKITRAAATIGNDAQGDFFQYDWTAPDTDTAGDFDAEFEATLSGGEVETSPNTTYILVRIKKDLN